MEWLLIMFWSQVISLQMQPSPFDKRYYATQTSYRIRMRLYLQVKYINMTAHSMLYYYTMKTQMVIIQWNPSGKARNV